MRTTTAAIAAAILSAGALASCGGSDDFMDKDVLFVRLQAPWPAGTLARTYVARTETEWERAWRANLPQTSPPTLRPAVDLTKSMVVGLSLGTGPNGCHFMAIEKVTEERDQVNVKYKYEIVDPGSVGVCTLAGVALVDFVTIPRTEKPVVFTGTLRILTL